MIYSYISGEVNQNNIETLSRIDKNGEHLSCGACLNKQQAPSEGTAASTLMSIYCEDTCDEIQWTRNKSAFSCLRIYQIDTNFLAFYTLCFLIVLLLLTVFFKNASINKLEKILIDLSEWIVLINVSIYCPDTAKRDPWPIGKTT